MSRRRVILTIAAILLFSLLIGCSNNESSDKKNTTVHFAIKTNATVSSQSNAIDTTTILILYPITEPITTCVTEGSTYILITTGQPTTATPSTTKAITEQPSTTVSVIKPTTKDNVPTTIKTQTEQKPQTTVLPQTTDKYEITILTSPGTVKRGKSATLEIRGTPNTLYSIKVKYSSGYSSAKGLEDKISDENGVCSWTWRVGAKTKPGSYNITVSDGQKDHIIAFSVE